MNQIRDVVKRVRNVNFSCSVEYILVDDCSTDGSWDIIQDIASECSEVIPIRQSVNRGKGAALHRGFREASGDVIAIQDADFEYDPTDLPKLVEPILQNRADVVYGSRYHKNSHQVHRTFHYLVNRFLTLLSNLMSGLYLSDMETCYKVFKTEILQGLNLESSRFGFEPEVTAKLAKLDVRMEEHPISYAPRHYDEGKNISWKDGIAAVWFIFKYNLQPIKMAMTNIPAKYVPSGRLWL